MHSSSRIALFALGLTFCLHPSLGYAQSPDGRFVTDWLVIGPFPQNDLESDFLGGEAAARPVEGDIVLTSSGDTLRWTRYRSLGSLIDFDHALAPADFVTGYAFAEIHSARDESVRFLVGSNDEVAVWINGRREFRHSVYRDLAVDEDTFLVDLRAGANACLVKVTEGVGTWGFALRAFPDRSPEGRRAASRLVREQHAGRGQGGLLAGI